MYFKGTINQIFKGNIMAQLNFLDATEAHFDYAIRFLEACVYTFDDVARLIEKNKEIYVIEFNNRIVYVTDTMSDSYNYVSKQNIEDADARYDAYVLALRDYDEEEICNALNITIPRKNYIEVLSAIEYEETRDLDKIKEALDALEDGQCLANCGITNFDQEGVEEAYIYLKALYYDIKFPERKVKAYIIKKMSEEAHIIFKNKGIAADNVLVAIRTWAQNMKYAYKIYSKSGDDLTVHIAHLIGAKLNAHNEILEGGFGTCRLFQTQQKLDKAGINCRVEGVSLKKKGTHLPHCINYDNFKSVGLD